MTTYAYVGRDRNGRIVRGKRTAEDRDALTAVLRREQILVRSAAAGESTPSRVRCSPDS